MIGHSTAWFTLGYAHPVTEFDQPGNCRASYQALSQLASLPAVAVIRSLPIAPARTWSAILALSREQQKATGTRCSKG